MSRLLIAFPFSSIFLHHHPLTFSTCLSLIFSITSLSFPPLLPPLGLILFSSFHLFFLISSNPTPPPPPIHLSVPLFLLHRIACTSLWCCSTQSATTSSSSTLPSSSSSTKRICSRRRSRSLHWASASRNTQVKRKWKNLFFFWVYRWKIAALKTSSSKLDRCTKLISTRTLKAVKQWNNPIIQDRKIEPCFP